MGYSGIKVRLAQHASPLSALHAACARLVWRVWRRLRSVPLTLCVVRAAAGCGLLCVPNVHSKVLCLLVHALLCFEHTVFEAQQGPKQTRSCSTICARPCSPSTLVKCSFPLVCLCPTSRWRCPARARQGRPSWAFMLRTSWPYRQAWACVGCRPLPAHHPGITRASPGHYQCITRALPGHCKAIARPRVGRRPSPDSAVQIQACMMELALQRACMQACLRMLARVHA